MTKLQSEGFLCRICGHYFEESLFKNHICDCEKEKEEKLRKLLQKNPKLEVESEEWTEPIPEISNSNALSVYNEKAMDFFQKSLLSCPTCDRRFNFNRLEVHLRNCTTVSSSPSKEKNDSPIKPEKKPLVVCYLCGKNNNIEMFQFHLNKCLQKIQVDFGKRPEKLRRPQDPKPPSLATPTKTSENSYIERYNQQAMIQLQRNHIPCKHCGRTFARPRLELHEKHCRPKSSPIGRKNRSTSIPEHKERRANTSQGESPYSTLRREKEVTEEPIPKEDIQSVDEMAMKIRATLRRPRTKKPNLMSPLDDDNDTREEITPIKDLPRSHSPQQTTKTDKEELPQRKESLPMEEPLQWKKINGNDRPPTRRRSRRRRRNRIRNDSQSGSSRSFSRIPILRYRLTSYHSYPQLVLDESDSETRTKLPQISTSRKNSKTSFQPTTGSSASSSSATSLPPEPSFCTSCGIKFPGVGVSYRFCGGCGLERKWIAVQHHR